MFVGLAIFVGACLVVLVDGVVVMVRYHRMRGVVRMMTLGDVPTYKLSVMRDLSECSRVNTDQTDITDIIALGSACLRSFREGFGVRTQIRCLNLFTDTLVHQIPNVRIRQAIIASSRISWMELFGSYVWTHAYVYSEKEQEKYVNIAYAYLHTFIDDLVRYKEFGDVFLDGQA